jgi:transposase-like protein
MKDRKGNQAAGKAKLAVFGKEERCGLREYLQTQAQLLQPMLQLVQSGHATIDELMSQTVLGLVERLLEASAQEVAGPKHPGRRGGEVRWHGTQPGRIVLAERKLALRRPRLRSRGAQGKEVAVPLYERLGAEPRLADRMRDIVVAGVATRRYAGVLPEMAGTAGVARSSVSRKFVTAATRSLKALMSRSLKELPILALWIDGIQLEGHHILAAVGLDTRGHKHLLSLVRGSSENAHLAKDLLQDLLARGLDPELARLFVIDGSKALRSAIEQLFGDRAAVQRCRVHKVRNVTERLPAALAAQVRAVMHAAYRLPERQGIAKLKAQAAWLKSAHPDAAASLLEGLEETFTVNRLGLTPALIRSLASTNIIENPNSAVRRVTSRVSRYRDADMALRWTAAGFLEAEKSFRPIGGRRDLWVLAAALGRATENVDAKARAA